MLSSAIFISFGINTLRAQEAAAVIPKAAETTGEQTTQQATKNDVNKDAQEDAKTQEEVVVVGYGTQRKKDVTGAVASVGAKDFNVGVINGPDQLIQGKAAGIQITSSDGSPNSSTTVRIRGNAAIRADAQPLYIVDGVFMDGGSPKPSLTFVQDLGGDAPASNPLAFLNPSDIESMEILKDASATAIYGSRGANGVIIITTKKGKKGETKVDFSASYGLSNISKRIEVATGDQYRALLDDYVTKKYITSDARNGANYGGNVNALDAILRTGSVQKYNLSMSGGSENSKLYASIGYQNQQGIVNKTSLERYNATLNGDFKFLDGKAGASINIIANQTNDQSAPISNQAGFKGSLIGQALQWNPTLNLTDTTLTNNTYVNADGKRIVNNGSSNYYKGYTQNKSGDQVNPLAFSNAFDDYTKTNTFIASIAPYIQLYKGLVFKVQLSTTQSVANRQTQTRNFVNIAGIIPTDFTKESTTGGIANIGTSQYATYQVTNTLSYNIDVDKLAIGAMLGYEYYNSQKKGSAMSGLDFGTTALNYYDIMTYSTAGTRTMSSYYDPTTELQSIFGRVNATYDEKYSATLTLRADGSSKFGANNKYGYFPSVGLAWNIDKEDFLKSVKVISFMKLRTSWGLTGNQSFPAGASQVRYTATGSGAFSQQSLANPNLQWQTDMQFNIGLDFGLLDNKITGTIEYFNKQTSNLLINLPAAAPSPGISQWSNLKDGIITNQGVEITVNAKVINNKNMLWTAGVNATIMQNQVSGLLSSINTGSINGQGVSGAFVQQMVNGMPLNTYYLKNYEGIDAATGMAKLTSDIPAYYGSPNPTTLLGINTSFTYKIDNQSSVNFSTSFNGNFGHYLYNNTANTILPINGIGTRNVSTSILNIRENPASPITTSTRYLEKGDFLRWTNATISYSYGKIGKIIKGVSIFVTGQNLYVFTNFTGFDPEVNVDKSMNGVPSVGIEYAPYPAARTFTAGFNISL